MVPMLSQWLDDVLPLLLSHSVKRMDGVVYEGKVSLYWTGAVLRMDLKPREDDRTEM
jgi:hypothetical protein